MALAQFLADLESLLGEANAAFGAAADGEALEAARIEFLGAAKGRLKAVQKGLGTVAKEDKPAAGKRHEHGRDIGHGVHDFQPERALPGNNRRVVEGRHHDEAVFGHQSIHLHLRFVLRPADDPHSGAEAPDFGDLVLRHEARHADRRHRALRLGRMGKRPAMISGRGGDHAARALFG